jgi:hypothetical protein
MHACALNWYGVFLDLFSRASNLLPSSAREYNVLRRLVWSLNCPLIASHYGAERPNRSMLRGACEQRDRTTIRDSYRTVEDIISYS